MTTKALPWPTPALARLDPAAMQLDQVLDQRQADAEPAARAGQRAFDLGKHGEDVGQLAPAGMPMPSSLTVILTSPSCSAAASSMRPRRSVYLAALVSRLTNTCDRRIGSASSTIGVSGRRSTSSCPLSSMLGRLASTASSTTLAPARRAPGAARSGPG